METKHSTINRMKRKIPLSPSTTKKLNIVKSTEFEPNVDLNENNLDRETDFDDYADRIFNYLGETYNSRTILSSPQVEMHSPTSSNTEMKPLLCAFCPYFARNIHEFQTHIAKHTEKNFRCLLCNCMYKYRRDCVTHMKRKHSNTVTGSISQYIQKINNTATNNCLIQPSSSTPAINASLVIEPKRYGCPYCSLMTKSTSSIYKHQSRKHALFPKLVHKYSTDDPTTRSLVAILKQKTLKKPATEEPNSTLISSTDKQILKSQIADEMDLPDSSIISSSLSSTVHHHTEPLPLLNRHRCAASKHITAHNIHSSNGRILKLFQCCLCGYRARHRSNVVRHVKKLHHTNEHETNQSKTLIDNEVNSQLIDNINQSEEIMIDHDEQQINQKDFPSEKIPNYSFNTIVPAPLILNKSNDNHNKPYADIHLSINIFLPKQNSFDRSISDCSNNEDDIHSDEDISDNDVTKIHINLPYDTSSSSQQNLSNGSLYKPHKCRRCFYRSNWKTDMLHHIRLKHHINHATKLDYISMDFDSALRSFSDYEKTFGKVLKNRLLLPKIDYTDCTWEELKLKLFVNDDQKKTNGESITEQATIMSNTFSSMNNEETNVLIDNSQ